MIVNAINIKFIYYEFNFFRINNIGYKMGLFIIISIASNERKRMFLGI